MQGVIVGGKLNSYASLYQYANNHDELSATRSDTAHTNASKAFVAPPNAPSFDHL